MVLYCQLGSMQMPAALCGQNESGLLMGGATPSDACCSWATAARLLPGSVARARGVAKVASRGAAKVVARARAMKDEGGGQEAERPGGSAESLFMKELQRRQMGPASTASSPPPPSSAAAASAGAGAGAGAREKSEAAKQPDSAATDGSQPPSEISEQLQRSRNLNSEGLEGLPARASALIQLGISFYVSQWPLALAFALAFASLYVVSGSSFIHYGEKYQGSRQPPSYIDPYELLEREEELLYRVPYSSFTAPSPIEDDL